MPAQFTCRCCGADIHPNASACAKCGASTKRKDSVDDGNWFAPDLELPDEDFDYDGFVKREFGGGGPKPPGISTLWWITGIIILIAFALIALRLS